MKKMEVEHGNQEFFGGEPGAGELEDQLFWAGLWAPAALGLLWLIGRFVSPYIPDFLKGCLWDKWLGIYCLGCGGTRALIFYLTGHFLKSLWYHPVVFYGLTLYLVFMVSHGLAYLSKGRIKGLPFRIWYFYIALGIMVFNCLLKNYLRFQYGILLE